jgi:hypothetical protein
MLREEGRIDLVKGERIQDTIATLRDTLFTVLKKMVISKLFVDLVIRIRQVEID